MPQDGSCLFRTLAATSHADPHASTQPHDTPPRHTKHTLIKPEETHKRQLLHGGGGPGEEQNTHPSPELQKYYEERFSTMATEGWKDLMEDIDNMINSLNNISTIPDEKSLQFKKGELSILVWLKTLKQVSTQAYEELNEKNV
jgi:hypothetical protein